MLKKFSVTIVATSTVGVSGSVDILPAGNPGRYFVTVGPNTDNVQPRFAGYIDGFASAGDDSSGSVGTSSAGVIVLGPLSAMSATITSQGAPSMTFDILTVEQIPDGFLEP